MAAKKKTAEKKLPAKVNGKAHPAVEKVVEGEVISLPKISPQEKRFVGHYAIHANAAAAVRFAEYDVKAEPQKGYELLMNPDVQAHVAQTRAKLGEIHFDLANSIIRQLDVMRLADITELYDGEGNLRDPRDWPEGVKLLVNGIEVEEVMTGEGDSAGMVRTKKVKLESRKGVMDTLAKILGVLRPDNQPDAPRVPTAVIFNVTVGGVKQ